MLRKKLYFCAHATTAAMALLTGMNAAAQTAETSGQAGIQEILVTATKRTTTLQSTPVAVSVLNGADLDLNHVQTIQDVTRLVPSFQATAQGDHGVITMTLRGIGNDSAKTEYADPEVALYVDGIYTARPEGASSLLFDMQSVEVLRGPQGTLWGRNATVGAVNMQTAKPTLDDVYGNLEAGVGGYGRVGTRGAINVPLTDKLAVRLSFAREKHDGYVDYQAPPTIPLAQQQAALAAYNRANGTNLAFQPLDANRYVQSGDKYNAQDQSAVRLSALWKPTDRLTWNVNFEYFQDRGTPNMNLLQTPRPGTSEWSALINIAPFLHRDVYSLRSRFDYDINDYLSVTYIAGYSWFKGRANFDQDGGATLPTSFASGGNEQEDRTNLAKYYSYSHEVELKSNGKHDLDWILGAYYGHEDNSIRFDINILNGSTQGPVNWGGEFLQPKETVTSKAVFGQATYHLTDKLHLTGGLRYTKDERGNEGGVGIGFCGAGCGGPVAVNQDARSLGWTVFSNNTGSGSWNKMTYLARVSYDFTPDVMGYASVSTGYKSGGVQDGGFLYNPETLTNYEAGLKLRLLGGRLTVNNAFFYEDLKNFQFSAPVTNPDGTHVLRTNNADGATVYGFESEIAARPTVDDLLGLSLSFQHTKLDHLIAGSNDYSLPPCAVPGISTCLDVTGHKLPHAPSFAAQLIYEHSFHLFNGATVIPRVSFHYETASWLSVFNLGDGDKQNSYTRTDLSVRYESNKPWSVELFVQNVEDDRIKTNAQNSFGAFQSVYLPPRTFGANFRYRF
ncbi:TonB-dependent receptor [Roseiterribacter gracilis]|uniref:TonB-dependent receptor n=1 Tax=Roseiterribacter gracilis TaxID=2812848 RepID=A0A8S8XCF7_9PROT|nr:TonB-dependent receptor [Rhodospirillales bacterium TMPK1]